MCKRQRVQATDPRDLVVRQVKMGEHAAVLEATDLTETVV